MVAMWMKKSRQVWVGWWGGWTSSMGTPGEGLVVEGVIFEGSLFEGDEAFGAGEIALGGGDGGDELGGVLGERVPSGERVAMALAISSSVSHFSEESMTTWPTVKV